MDYMRKIKESISNLEEDGMTGYIERLLKMGKEPIEIINQALIPGIENVGELYQEGEYFIPELLYGLEIMNRGMDLLLPHVSKNETKRYGNVVIGTVEGDTHDIGKNIVASLLEASGFGVTDLGNDVAPEEFVRHVKEHDTDIVAMSALLTSTMGAMGDTIELLKKEGLREKVKVMIGGAVITENFRKKIGADAFCVSAMDTVKVAKKYCEEKYEGEVV